MASPELQMVLEMLRGMTLLNPESTIDEQRAGMEAATAVMPLPDDVQYEPTSAGGVPAEWTRAPGVSRERVVLYLHGGGYVIGSIATHRLMCAGISRASGATVLSLEYRLGPEHKFPAAVDDATAAYRWLLAEGYKPRQLAIAGDSAGGGLTMATLLALRDADVPLPAAGVCLSPWVDLTGSGESMTTKAAVDPMVQKAGLLKSAGDYLGKQDPKAPLASPVFANLRGLPPLLLQVGTAETLLDDSTRLAANAKRDGVDVTLEVWDDMVHVFQAFAFMLPEGQQAIEGIGAYLRKRWG
jgi:epsilon-lactone hydrolase